MWRHAPLPDEGQNNRELIGAYQGIVFEEQGIMNEEQGIRDSIISSRNWRHSAAIALAKCGGVRPLPVTGADAVLSGVKGLVRRKANPLWRPSA
jgi:hypothetical protein